MRTYPEALGSQLSRSLQQSYLLLGNEPLLKSEVSRDIFKAARQAGFEEKHHFAITNQLDWQEVFDCCQALSLFSQRQVISLEMPDTGLTAPQSKQLVNLAEMLHSDILLVIFGPRINKRQESAQWFKALTKAGVWVPCNSPELRQLPRFIQQRCQTLKLQADPESVQFLAQLHEGNLLALAQSLEKLALLFPDGQLTLVRLEEALSSHSHYTPFQLVDALLAGQTKRAQRVLQRLEGEGVEPIIILRTLQRELMQLNKIHELGMKGQTLQITFEQLKIWQTRRPLITGALQRLPRAKVIMLLSLLAALEIEAKTEYDNAIWSRLRQFSIEMCGLAVKPLTAYLP
ncbi:DNA polymerase III subunit delta [Thaumasiovibrio sp. DFM-14]|uniref:DNA polymerase III subunit delta n=1 Tax=Thaumasiovibrio sp. DFM-14 TaxID=3384792 RepID=UPI0039A017AC